MFWKHKSGAPRGFKEPTSFDKKMGFEKWLSKAHEADKKKLTAESEHLYFHKVKEKEIFNASDDADDTDDAADDSDNADNDVDDVDDVDACIVLFSILLMSQRCLLCLL